METETGLLTTPCPVAVIVADPVSGLPAELPLHTTKAESQTPPQTKPVGETVTNATLDELNVNVAVTGLPGGFAAVWGGFYITAPAWPTPLRANGAQRPEYVGTGVLPLLP